MSQERLKRLPVEPRVAERLAQFVSTVAIRAEDYVMRRDRESMEAAEQAALDFIVSTAPIHFSLTVKNSNQRMVVLEKAAQRVKFYAERETLFSAVKLLGMAIVISTQRDEASTLALDGSFLVNHDEEVLKIAFWEAPELLETAVSSGKEAATLELIVLLRGDLPLTLTQRPDGAQDAATVIPGVFIRYQTAPGQETLQRSIVVNPM